MLALGEDYMRAGLLDRAETLFSDLVNIDARAPSALKHLISIYQQERDWHKAIDHARRLEQATGESQGRVIAQYYCELTEHARGRHDLESARRFLAEAFACEANCVRGRRTPSPSTSQSPRGVRDGSQQRSGSSGRSMLS